MTDPSDDFAGNLADIPGSPADGRHTLAVIGAVDPALLDLVDLALAGQDAVVIRAGLHFAADDEADSSDADDDLVRLVSHSSAEGFDDEPVRLDVPMPSTCPTCSLREVLAAVAQDRAAQDPGGTTVILLPAAIELAHLLPGLAEELAGTGVRLAGAAHVLDAMQPDDAADLVADLPQLKAAELLGLMEPEEAEDVRRLMAYDDYTAGGLMTTEPIILPPESTVATFLAQSRKAEIPPALAAVGFVCRPPLESPTGKFVGMIHFQRALRERPQRLVGSIVDTDIDSVRAEDSIGTVTRLLATYNLTALPVLDDAGRLLGAVSVDDVLDHLMPDDWRVADEAVTDETIERGANA